MATTALPPEADLATPDPAPARVTSRRSALKIFGLGAATIAVVGTGVLSYRVFDNGVLNSGTGRTYDPWLHWRDDPSPLGAVGAAILAANPHNTQAWLFAVTATSVDVFADPTRTMANVDPVNREHQVGLGCALENLLLGLGFRGYSSTITLRPDPAEPNHLATVDLTGGAASEPTGATTTSALHEAIGQRHSQRGPYSAAAVPQAVLDGLSAQAADLPGLQVRWFTSPTERAAVGALMVSAAEAFIADTGQSEEAFSWFRNNRDDIDTHADGPTLDAQGLDPLTLSLAKILPASSRAAGDAFWLEQTRTVHTATAAAYGMISVLDPADVQTRLNAGRLLQRIHLAATVDGLGLQHMNQITERVDRERSQGVPATFAGPLQEVLAQPGRQSLVAFRIGYPERAALRSPRRPLADVIR